MSQRGVIQAEKILSARHGTMESTAYLEFDFPYSLLTRLLVSEIVPLQAKIKAIESWRHELAESRSFDPHARELQARLAIASRVLRTQRLKQVTMKTANWINDRLRQPWDWLRKNTDCPGQGFAHPGPIGTLQKLKR